MVSKIKLGDLMAKTHLNSKLLNQLALKIGDSIPGEWLVFGGSMLYLIGIDSRSTIDIDVTSFSLSTNADTLKLMKLAEELQLPIETINQSDAFFLNQIENWQGRCELFHKGKIGKIYIPNINLYIELKSSRMSESDLSDCKAYLNWCNKNKISYDKESLMHILRKQSLTANKEKKSRLQELKDYIKFMKQK